MMTKIIYFLNYNKFMRKFILQMIILFSLYCNGIYGQICTVEEPTSFRKTDIPDLKMSSKTVKSMPSLDMKRIIQEDNEEESKGLPPRFGYRLKVDYNLDNSGEWTVLSNGDRIWRLIISCPGALSINLLYDKFWIPDGAKFFIYSNDHRHIIGAITSENNKGDRKNIQGFATGLVYGDQITLEYYLPKEVEEVGVISVAYVVHGYRYIVLQEGSMAGYGESGSCQVNINCSEGQNWQNEKSAVAMILVNGDRWCTGSLVNTTANDNRPLFLTANHCLTDGSDAITAPNLSYWSFYWHYESPGCTNASPTIRSTVGATVVANNNVSDFALLRLTENPLNASGVTPYYLGWDCSGNAGTGGVGIHHPSGDIKKIATYNTTPTNSSCMGSLNNNFWQTGFIQTLNGYSVMQPGSSGSPLINSNHRVIGQLYGPGACSSDQCNNPSNQRVSYGKFSISWTGNSATDSRRRLRDWLDPNGTNSTTLDGRGPVPTLSGSTTLCLNSSATYTINNFPTNATVTWSQSSNLQPVSGSGASKVYKGIATGAGWIEATVNGITASRFNVWVGAPVISSIDGETSTIVNAVNRYYCITSGPTATTTFTWSGPPGGYRIVSAYLNSVDIIFTTSGQKWVDVVAGNTCGSQTSSKNVSVKQCQNPPCQVVQLSITYPNPVDDMLNIEINGEAGVQTRSMEEQTITGSKTIRQDATYDVRLYDGMGTLLRRATVKSGKVEFDVSNLADGIYYLHIYDGINEKPEMTQIIVQH
jgi:hypothetical protein